jgi:outer membrane protein
MKIIFLLFLTTNVFAIKIGYINTELLLSGSSQFKESQFKIKQEFSKKESDLRQDVKNARKVLNNYNELKKDLTKDERQSQVIKIRTLDKNLQKKAEKIKKQFDLRSNEELLKIQNKINIIIKDFAIKNKFDLILYKDVAYVGKNIDITMEIAKELENK